MKTYQGLLSLHSYGESDDILFLSSLSEPLVVELEWMEDRNVTVRYWVTEKKISKEEAQLDFMKQVAGCVNTEFTVRYSELTGYLWTDEELQVGGHDLLEELRSSVGKWLIIEIK